MKEIRKRVRGFMEERNWFEAVPANIAKSISIEASELLEHFQWSHELATELKKNKKKTKEISHELADVMIYAIHLAELIGLDAEQAIEEKLKKANKKYPTKIFNKNILPGQNEYLEIKKKYRKK